MVQMPTQCTPSIIGDLNIDLEHLRDYPDEAVAEAMDAHDVMCYTCHFSQHQHRLVRGQWT